MVLATALYELPCVSSITRVQADHHSTLIAGLYWG